MSRLSQAFKNSEKLENSWNQVASALATRYPRINQIFSEYTIHDQAHLDSLEDILDWLIPDTSWSNLNETELFVLRCALWSHDIGMGAEDDIIKQYCDTQRISVPDKDELLNFLRVHHAELSKVIIEGIVSDLDDSDFAPTAKTCGDIALSHHQSDLSHLYDARPFGPAGIEVNCVYLAILVRLADILHCTSDRAPRALMLSRKVENPISISHWKRHQATVGVTYSTDKRSLVCRMETNDPEIFKSCKNYSSWIQAELDLSAKIYGITGLEPKGYAIVTFRLENQIDVPFQSFQ